MAWPRLLSLFAILLPLWGCTGSSAPEGVLRVQLATEPVSLDPSLAEDGASMRVMSNIWAGLVGYDSQGKLVNRLAREITISPDGLRYVIALREGVKWSDGVPVLPGHFVTGIKRSLSHKTAAKLAPMLFPIKGARDFHKGKSNELPGVRVAEGNLVIELERPAPYLSKALALSIALPQRQEILVVNGGAWPTDAPTTGIFRLASYVRGQKITLARNGETPSGHVREVEMRIVSDDGAAVSLLERGTLDVLTRVPTLDLERLLKAGLVNTEPFGATYYVAFNVKKPPFDRLAWRRAIASSILKAELTAALATGETPARSWIPVGLEGYQPFEREASPAVTAPLKAQMTAHAPVEAAFDSSSRNSLVMEKIQYDVRAMTGLKLSLVNLDWKSYIRKLQTDAPPIYRFAWLAPFGDPVPHLQVFTGGNPNNYTGWSSAKYDALVAEVERMASGPAREKKIQAAQKVLLEDEVIVVPLYHYVQNHAVSKRVKNFRVNPFGAIAFDAITLGENP